MGQSQGKAWRRPASRPWGRERQAGYFSAPGVTIYSAAEAGIRSDHHASTTQAPIGHAPAVAARVVVSTAGPYRVHRLTLVQACAEAGTDYADLTGEVLLAASTLSVLALFRRAE